MARKSKWAVVAEKESCRCRANPKVKLDLLFEHDGCKVYRFHDFDYRYFSDCRGEIESTVSCGKNCWREDVTMNTGR